MDNSISFNIHSGAELTWNVKPLLFEVLHALKELVERGESRTIDLRSIPLAPGEEDRILELLGQGEITAHLDALGESEIRETRYSGVWLITHYNTEQQLIGRFIEISACPSILSAQAEDMANAVDNLSMDLDHSVSTSPNMSSQETGQ